MNYKAHYDRLITRGQNRILEGYKERHHVIPKCMGGDNAKANIVELTAEEHYVAHQLLVKMHPGHAGLALSAVRMAPQCSGNKAYGWLRRRHAECVAITHRGMKRSAETRAKLSAVRLGKKFGPLSPEHRANIGAGHKGKVKTPEHRAKLAASHLGKKLTAEHRAKVSASLIGNKRISPETYARIFAQNRGRKHTAEELAKMSAKRIGWKMPKEQVDKMRERKASPETRAKMSAAHKRRHLMRAGAPSVQGADTSKMKAFQDRENGQSIAT